MPNFIALMPWVTVVIAVSPLRADVTSASKISCSNFHVRQKSTNFKSAVQSEISKLLDLKDPNTEFWQRVDTHGNKREKVSLELNKATFGSLMVDGLRTWREFPTANLRTNHPVGLKTPCFPDNDPKFRLFSRSLYAQINREFSQSSIAKPLVKLLATTPLYSAGRASFFGAIATTGAHGSQKICINPEEAPPLLMAKLLHELKHISNQALHSQKKEFRAYWGRWSQKARDLERQEERLYDLEDEIENLSIDELLETTDRTIESALRQQKVKAIKHPGILKAVLDFRSNQESYKTLSAEIKSKKVSLDQNRFLDELAAYFVSIKAGQFLVARDPELYCRLWVPSHTFRLPVRFYEYYQYLESKLLDRSLPQWVAKTYTKKSRTFDTESLFADEASLRLLPSLETATNRIMNEALRTYSTLPLRVSTVK